MRSTRWRILGAVTAALVLVAAACGDDDGDGAGDGTGDGGVELVFGASEQCFTRPQCLPGLERVYGLDFAGEEQIEFGAALGEALGAGDIDVTIWNTTAPQITVEGFVVLEDDQGLFPAQNIAPVVRSEIVEAYGDDFVSALDELSAAITTEDLLDWNERTDIDFVGSDVVAADWLEAEGLLDVEAEERVGPQIRIRPQDFSESVTINQVYGQYLEALGYPVQISDPLGFRDAFIEALDNDQIDFTVDYIGGSLAQLSGEAGPGDEIDQSDPDQVLDAIRELYAEIDVEVLEYSPAVDGDALVVRGDFAAENDLVTISDLAALMAG